MAGKMVDFPSNGHSTKGYLATPASGKGPGVLVIQEWWGLVGHIKNVSDRFAAAGFSALAPDLYHGQTATEPDAAGKLFMALNIARAEKDLAGAAKHLAGHSSTAKLGAVGFCMGGQLALFAGCTNASVGAGNPRRRAPGRTAVRGLPGPQVPLPRAVPVVLPGDREAAGPTAGDDLRKVGADGTATGQQPRRAPTPVVNRRGTSRHPDGRGCRPAAAGS